MGFSTPGTSGVGGYTGPPKPVVTPPKPPVPGQPPLPYGVTTNTTGQANITPEAAANIVYTRQGGGTVSAPDATALGYVADHTSDPARSSALNNLSVAGTPAAAGLTPPPPPPSTWSLPQTQPPQAAGPSAPPGEGYGPGFGEQYGKDHIGNYDQPTALETFFQQQLTGDNPYYQRLQQQQADQINQQMAARGHYNSGGAMAALGNASGALYADQFANMGNLAGQVSNLELNRYGQGFQQAQGVQGMAQNRINSQFGQAGQLAALGAGSYGGFYNQGGQQSGDAAMNGINAGANAAQLQGQGQGATLNTAKDIVKAYIQK